MAGALAHSGYEVPQAIKGNETNPQGFFEPRWVVNFHRKLLTKSGVRTLDADPAAIEAMEGVNTDAAVREELHTWLGRQLEKRERIVIKDPRMVWFSPLWREVAQGLGADPGFIVMLRHPSEVSSSRTEYYNARQVTGVAGWINTALATEQLTHGSPRAFVHYPNLTAEWRPELTRVRELLSLGLEPAPEVTPHPIDDFIDPKLRRMKPGWDAISVPADLAALGDRTFDALGSIADGTAGDELDTVLSTLREEYAQIHQDALDLVSAHLKRKVETARRNGVRKGRAAAQKAAAAPAVAAPEPGLAARIGRRLRGSAGTEA